jgi:hypothetical protein
MPLLLEFLHYNSMNLGLQNRNKPRGVPDTDEVIMVKAQHDRTGLNVDVPNSILTRLEGGVGSHVS